MALIAFGLLLFQAAIESSQLASQFISFLTQAAQFLIEALVPFGLLLLRAAVESLQLLFQFLPARGLFLEGGVGEPGGFLGGLELRSQFTVGPFSLVGLRFGVVQGAGDLARVGLEFRGLLLGLRRSLLFGRQPALKVIPFLAELGHFGLYFDGVHAAGGHAGLGFELLDALLELRCSL